MRTFWTWTNNCQQSHPSCASQLRQLQEECPMLDGRSKTAPAVMVVRPVLVLHPVLIETANTADHIRHALLAFTSWSATRDEVVHPSPAPGS
jgi:hypothetical protein